ncbi:aminomethyltransferase [Polymorphobacter glacialis]|uniref:aminomethyltransferase n=1 Tax=Sandarakinorhabdus glacialis TaxID=1614636 RepID=A0A916ZI81_9SPHN|nr:glycine cleavage system aminomethyltransferase GcvT [Polymorphobacter glacialis]GGD99196.1 aminomethyltransferase [Polymorphobacter glacialis]
MADTDPTLALPLDGLHRRLGARMVPFAGYAMPIQYVGEFGGIIAEHLWTRTSAGLFDVSHMGQVLLPLAEDTALETLIPGDITGLAIGALRYSLLLDETGGILDDLMVTRRAADLYLVVNGAVKTEDIAHLRAHGLTVTYRDDWALLALQGPLAVTALDRLVPGVAGVSGASSIADLRFMRAAAFTWNGHALWISRSGYTGEDGYEISLPAAAAEAFAEALLAQPEVKPIGLGARDSLRLEAGLPLYGHDLDTTTDPIEAGLQFAISKRRKIERGFPAADALMARLHDGPTRKRVGLLIEGKLPAREGALVFSGDKQIGTVTSGGFSPSLGVPIAMAYVNAAHAADGTAVEIEVRGKRLAATVTPMPFKPKNYVRAEGAPT